MEPTSKKKPAVVLVHGTFANREDSEVELKPKEIEREGWWRDGSRFSNNLKQNLADLDAEIVPFAWSSENKERDRHEAGQALLDQLVEYEKQGRDYHLIGHSHGGSVIWIALQQALMRRWRSGKNEAELKLPHLKSWATVGTPFLHYRPSWLGEWYGKVVTMLTLILSVMMMVWLGQHEFERWGNEGNPLSVLTQPFESLKPMPEFPERELQKQNTGEPAPATQIKLDWSNKPITAGDWIAAFGELIFAFILLVAPIFALYLWIRAQRTEACNVNREIRAQNQALLDYGDRWLGVWCTEDEAINGLRSTVGIPDCEIIPRISIPGKRIFASDRLIRFYRFFIRIFFKPLNNRVIAPRVDSYLLGRIAKGAQGHNRPGAILVDVTEGPVLIEGHRYPTLPQPVNQEIIDTANDALSRRAGKILTNTRSAFSQTAWGGAELKNIVASVKEELEGDELVHTSYFENGFVEEALTTHVREEQARENEDSAEAEVRAEKPRRSIIRALLWVLFGGGLAWLSWWENAETDVPFLTYSGSIFLLGIATIVSAWKSRETTKKRTWVASIITGVLMVVPLVVVGLEIFTYSTDSLFDKIEEFFVSDSKFANPGLVIGTLATVASMFLLISLHQTKGRPLLSRTCSFLAQAFFVAAVWASEVPTDESWLFAGALFVIFGLCKAFQPLRNQQDLFCPLEKVQLPDQPAVPGGTAVGDWVQTAKDSLHRIRNESDQLKIHSLTQLGHKNRIAFVWFAVFLLGIAGAIASIVMQDITFDDMWLYIAWAPVALSVLALFLSFRPAFRASRGARHYLVAAANIHLMSFLAICLVVALFHHFVYEGLLKIPRDSTPPNLAYVRAVDELPAKTFVIVNGEVLALSEDRETTGKTGTYADFFKCGPDHRALALVRGSYIELWDRAAKSETVSFSDHEHSVSALDFIANRRVIVSGSMDGVLHFWDRQSGVSLEHFKLRQPVVAMQAHPSKNLLAIGLGEGSVILFDTLARKKIAKERLHGRNDVKFVGFQGENILSLDSGGSLRLSKHDGEGNLVEPIKLPDHFEKKMPSHYPVYLRTDPETEKVAIIWRARESSELLLQISDQTGSEHWKTIPTYVREEDLSQIALAFGPGKDGISIWLNDGHYNYRDDAELFVWEDSNEQELFTGNFSGYTRTEVKDIQFLPDNNSLIIQANRSISVWDTGSGDIKHSFRGNSYSYQTGRDTLAVVDDVAMREHKLSGTGSARNLNVDGRMISNSRSEKLIATFSDERFIDIWNRETGRSVYHQETRSNSDPIVAFSADQSSCAIANREYVANQSIKIFDTSTWKETCELPLSVAWTEDAVKFNGNGTRVVGIGTNGNASLWDAVTGEEIYSSASEDGRIDKVVFNPVKDQLAVMFRYGSTHLIDSRNGELLNIFGGVNRAVSFSPDGSVIATRDNYGILKLWDTENGEEIFTFPESNSARQIRFSPDGKTIATIDTGRAIKIWEAKTGKLIREIVPFNSFLTREEQIKKLSLRDLLSRHELDSSEPGDQSMARLISEEIHSRFERDLNDPELGEKWAGYMFELMVFHLRNGRFQQAVETSEVVNRLAEIEPQTQDDLNRAVGIAYIFLNRMDEAKAIFKQPNGDYHWQTDFSEYRYIEGLVTPEVDARFQEIEKLQRESAE